MIRNDLFHIHAEPIEYYKGGSAAPPPPDPQREAEAREWEASRQAARDDARRAEDRRMSDEKAAKDLTQWQGRRNSAYNNARDYGKQQLSRYGLDENDPYGVFSGFTSQLDRNNAQLQDNQDFSTQLGSSVFDSALSNARMDQRKKLSRQFDNGIGSNYLEDTFADTADDQYLDGILGEQYNEANTYLTSARDRGQLNNFAYDKAISTLNQDKSKARGELETIGRGVLATSRDNVGKRRDATMSRINAFDFGDTLNVGDEVGRVKSQASTALGGLDADIRRAIGGRQFFDPNSIVAKSSASTGVSNYTPAAVGTGGTGMNPLLGIFTDQQRNKQTQGAF